MADGDKLTGTFVGTFTGTFTPTAPAPSPTPSPPPGATPAPPAAQAESPNGTTIPQAPAIFDSEGARWSVASDKILRNGVATISSNVALLLYHGGVVYQKNSAGGWWKWQNNGWVDAVDPRASSPAPSPAPAPSPGPAPAPAPSTGVPTIEAVRHPADMLEVGPYWIIDNRWGMRGLTEGSASYQFMQAVERSRTLTPSGGAACRIVWKWPEFNQQGQKINDNSAYSEVKGYPCISYGNMPGHSGSDQWPAFEFAVRAPDDVVVPSAPANAPENVKRDWQPKGGSVIRRVPCSAAPGHVLPKRVNSMAPGSLTVDMKWKKTGTSGRGHLSWDIWLQETPDQAFGFNKASLTHEIMIPMGNWGIYGRHPNGRNPGWYSHDVTIDGVVYHVYLAGAAYSFGGGSMQGNFTNEETGGRRTGWKFVVFQHDGDNHPTDASGNIHLDFPKFFAHMTTHKGLGGVNIARGVEYCTNLQLGVEMVYGPGDVTIYDFDITGK